VLGATIGREEPDYSQGVVANADSCSPPLTPADQDQAVTRLGDTDEQIEPE